MNLLRSVGGALLLAAFWFAFLVATGAVARAAVWAFCIGYDCGS